MKKLFTYITAIFLSGNIIAQTQFENNGFENWEDLEIKDTLNNWFSIFGTFYPNDPNVSRIDDGVSGSAVRMETVENIEGEPAQAGIILANSFGDEPDGYPYDSRVDELNAYLRYDIAPSDTGFVLVFLENDGDPFSFGIFPIYDTQDSWELFTWELTGPDLEADAVSVAFFSSGYSDGEPVVGSWLEVDSVFFTYDGPEPSPLPNFDFEDWTTLEIEVSSNWNSFDPLFRSVFGLQNITKTTDAYAGDYALKMETFDVNVEEEVFPFISNGTYNLETEDLDGGTPYTEDPILFKGQYKFLSEDDDSAGVYIRFWNTEGDTAQYADTTLMPVDDWTEFSLPVDLWFTPDSVLVVLVGGKLSGAETFFDEIRFVYDDVSVPEYPPLSVTAYPNPANHIFTVDVDHQADVIITDMTGMVVYQENQVNEFTIVKTSDWANGMYLVRVQDGDRFSTERIVVQH